MPSSDPQDSIHSLNAGRFATTQWSMVLAAGQQTTPQSKEALARLCETYWFPLYSYVRRHGHGVTEAQDLTQEFFAQLLEKNYIHAVRRERGRFRAYLLTALKHFLANEWDRLAAKKRGGRKLPISLDLITAENHYSQEPAHDLTPDKIFDKRWALALLEKVLGRLRTEYERLDKLAIFERLKVFLVQKKEAASYSEIAVELNMTEGALKVAVHRLRRRYRTLLKEEISQTVADPAELDDEIQHLFTALGY